MGTEISPRRRQNQRVLRGRGVWTARTSLAPLWRTGKTLPRFNVQCASVSITTGSEGGGMGKERDCSVKRLIRDKRTKKFLTAQGSWTTDVSEADDFGNITLVIKAEQHHNLNGV